MRQLIMKAHLITIPAEDGRGMMKQITPEKGEEFSLKEMYELIGCNMVEHVTLTDDVSIWADEEGLLKNDFIINPIATALYRAAYPDVPPDQLGIVGNIILEDRTEKGDYLENFLNKK